ncbi:Uncharacterised protein [Cedecea neteri]|uniref:Uncharacterized protein n=1 Tax=Cedecea neteri TaxID=158822 RepID=A0A2X3JB56_9ENTR|nr:Uncharacterised protein [Cedecea neteri]
MRLTTALRLASIFLLSLTALLQASQPPLQRYLWPTLWG